MLKLMLKFPTVFTRLVIIGSCIQIVISKSYHLFIYYNFIKILLKLQVLVLKLFQKISFLEYDLN